MLAGLTGFHLVALVAVVVVLFGATKLPVFARSLGQSVKILRGEARSSHEADATEQAAAEPIAQPVVQTTTAQGPIEIARSSH